jgi:hypothetical protein
VGYTPGAEFPDSVVVYCQVCAEAMKLSLEVLIGQRLTAVMVSHRCVQLVFDDHCALTILNPIVLTSPSGDVDCSHHGFEDFLRELIGRSMSDIDYKRGKVRRIALVFADAVLSIGRKEQGSSEPAMLLVSGFPGSYDPIFFVLNNETRLGSYPFDC